MKYFASFRGALFGGAGLVLLGLWLTITGLARQALVQALRTSEVNKATFWMRTREPNFRPMVLEGRLKEAERLAVGLTRHEPFYQLESVRFLNTPRLVTGPPRARIRRVKKGVRITMPMVFQVQVREPGKVIRQGDVLTFTESIRFEDKLHGDWTMVVSDGAFKSELRIAENKLALAGLGSLAAFVVVLFVLSGFLTKPVQELVSLGKRVEDGNLSQEAGVTGPQELRGAIHAANSMMHAVRKREQEREEQLQALQELQEKTHQLAALQAHFTAAVSHELKTPLVGIEGFGRLLAESLDGQPKEDARKILASALHLKSLINTLLDTVRLSQGELALHPRATELDQVLADFHQVAAYVLERAHAPLEVSLSPPPGKVLLDPDRLLQIILNLVGNALRHAENKPVELDLCHSGDMLYITVTDQGPGIPAQDRERVFEPFVQLGESRGKPEGTGLGLFIVRSLARNMGGDVSLQEADQKSGAGACFKVWVAAPVVSE